MEACLINVETFATAQYEIEAVDYLFVLIGPKANLNNSEIEQIIANNSYHNGKVDYEYKASDIQRYSFDDKQAFVDWIHSMLRQHPSIDVADSEYGEVLAYNKINDNAVPVPWFAVQDFVQPFVL